MQKWPILFLLLLTGLPATAQNLNSRTTIDHQQLRPWPENHRYWQYKGEPTLLLGGSKTDHLFLADSLLRHLDEIQSVGGNYVRNTMSQREALEKKPYLLKEDGSFDLNEWNPEYWSRFEKMLKWTDERDIIVQIELWDRFDFSREFWEISPWNPELNTNYSTEETGLADSIPNIPRPTYSPFSIPFRECPITIKNSILYAGTKKPS